MNNSIKIRIKDVAKKAKVSVGTVDRVLHNRGEVSAQTRELVNSIIEEMGYKPNAIASALAQKKKTRISVVMPLGGNLNPFYDAYEKGIAKATQELIDFGVQVDLLQFDPILHNFNQSIQQLLDSDPDAYVISPAQLNEEELNLLKKLDSTKLTLFGPNSIENQSSLLLHQDAFKSGYVGARILSYGLSKETTVLIVNIGKNSLNDQLFQDRIAGFKQYLKDRNITEMSIRTIEVNGLDEADIKKTLTNAFLDYSFVRGLFIPGSHVGKVARFIEEKKLGNIRVVGYDLTDENVTYLKKGYIDFILSQNPQWQSYRAVMSTFEHHVLGKEIEHKKIPVDIITKDNVDEFLES